MTVLSEIQAEILTQDELVAGIIENIITVNNMFQVLPFDAINGSALDLSDEDQLGAAGMTSITGANANLGDFSFIAGSPVAANPITADALPTGFDADNITPGPVQGPNFKSPATFVQRTFRLKSIIGDAEVNGLVQATFSGENDQEEVQIASKAKQVGRIYQACFINGNEAASGGLQFDGLATLAASNNRTFDANGALGGTAPGVLTFENLDLVLDEVKDKDGIVDYIATSARTKRTYKTILRALGGAAIDDVVTLENGEEVLAYEGIPWFRNDYILNSLGAGTNESILFAGTLDDGSRSQGISGLTATNAAGINVVEVGEREDSDANLTRIKWYSSLAQFNILGLAALTGLIPA